MWKLLLLLLGACEAVGAVACENLKENFGGEDNIMNILMRSDCKGKPTSAKMNDEARILNQIINKMILHKIESKDFV